ncbi:MAG: hypothetical protein CL928_18745 [Deltaproteobacteria bacterium]|nr:hypothetical protein [Deltaproteobacteria bacterium]
MAAATSPLDAAVQEAVRTVRARWQQTLPIVVDSTQWTVRAGQVSVTGAVLTQRQADDYVTAISAIRGTQSVPRPPLLSDPNAPWSDLQWARLSAEEPIDLLQRPGGELQNQWSPPAWVRLFAVQNEHSLVQLPDGTIGWVVSTQLDAAGAVPTEDPWQHIRRAAPSRALTPTDSAVPVGDLLEQASQLARSRLGRPYLWGGNLPRASDCSGFVQSVIWGVAGILLPKNTRDQQRTGEPVPVDETRAGDLVFVRGRELGLHHVGMVLESTKEPNRLSVIHASMSRNAILEEGWSAFLDRHDYLDTRRVVDWQHAPLHPSADRTVRHD